MFLNTQNIGRYPGSIAINVIESSLDTLKFTQLLSR